MADESNGSRNQLQLKVENATYPYQIDVYEDLLDHSGLNRKEFCYIHNNFGININVYLTQHIICQPNS